MFVLRKQRQLLVKIADLELPRYAAPLERRRKRFPVIKQPRPLASTVAIEGFVLIRFRHTALDVVLFIERACSTFHEDESLGRCSHSRKIQDLAAYRLAQTSHRRRCRRERGNAS
jgi:hypothetical protein